MKTFIRPMPCRFKSVLPVVFVLGIVVLAGTWVALWWGESVFTESHLVGYYCCVTEQDLPARGSLERAVTDFFRTLPGRHLPSLILVAGNASLFAIHVRRGGRDYWWLPFLFGAVNLLYLLVDYELMVASWSISDQLVGPQTSVYKAFDRTWYGIVLHLMLWGVFFVTLSEILRKLLPRRRSIRVTNRS